MCQEDDSFINALDTFSFIIEVNIQIISPATSLKSRDSAYAVRR